MAEKKLTSLGTNINSPTTQLMVMLPTAERTGAEASGSTMWDERYLELEDGEIK